MSALSVLPANLPSISGAKLPETYAKAQAAIAACARVDECKDWADKAEALASYAKQSGDTKLREMADRIQARAIRRCGELLREIESAQGRRTDRQLHTGDRTRSQAAADAGLSKWQKNTALRVANVPAQQFEAAVESDNPPTVTALADSGKKPAPKPLINLGGRNPKEFALSTEAQGTLRRFAEMAARIDPSVVVRGSFHRERPRMLEEAESMLVWLECLAAELRKDK